MKTLEFTVYSVMACFVGFVLGARTYEQAAFENTVKAEITKTYSSLVDCVKEESAECKIVPINVYVSVK